MKLDEFIGHTTWDLERFHSYWVRNNYNNPEWFPEEMNEADWFEQFIIFLNKEET